tara:strand:- start:13592 stop:15025 length:1434 start_codon:yes stop_codon:yes gene_type:complete
MAGEWESKSIASLMEDGVIVGHKDGNYGSSYPRKSEFGHEGIPFLTAKLLDDTSGRIDFENAPRLCTEKASRLTFGYIKANDVLLSHNATIGRVAVVPELAEPVLIGTSLTYFRVDESRLSPRYLAAFFKGRDFQNQLIAVMSHSTRNQVPITAQRRLKITIPPLPEQRAIASILGALDDKIELNRRMNATLESLARAIFKSWFVDFDPVRSKSGQQAEPPSGTGAATATSPPPRDLSPDSSPAYSPFTLPPSLSALFSSTFQDSDLGDIPEGWSTTPLYETAQFVNGASFKSQDFCDPSDGLPVVKIAELKNGLSAQTKYSARELDDTRTIGTGDLLYSWSGSPDTSLAVFVWSHGRGLLNQHIFKVITESQEQKHYVFYLLKYLRSTLVEIARNKQTTGLGHVTVADMKRLHVCKPPDEILSECDKTLGPIYDRCFANERESLTLSALRDTLLPKLLSGELPVPAALTATEEALA